MGHIHFFYVEPRDVGLDKLVLRAAEYNHAARVLRLDADQMARGQPS